MDPQVKVEDDKLICLKHNEIVLWVVADNKVPLSDKFLCSKCFETNQNGLDKVIKIESAIEQIKEGIAKRKQLSRTIKQFRDQIRAIQNEMVNLFNEILIINQQWIDNLKKQKKKDGSVLNELELFCESKIAQKINFLMFNDPYLTKIDEIYEKLLNVQDYKHCYSILNNIREVDLFVKREKIENNLQREQQDFYQIGIQQQSSDEAEWILQSSEEVECTQQQQTDQKMENICIESNSSVSVKLIESIKKENTLALAFNNTGNIMVSTSKFDLKVWKFENETLSELQTLTGHYDWVYCIVFSQSSNWFISCSQNKMIKCWREKNEQWICTDTQKEHTVGFLILNKSENQLISYGWVETIIVWKVDSYKLEYDYSLDKHTKSVYSISLNESETALVSCSYDKQIILWVKDQNDKWKFQHHITNDDEGYRICFIDNNSIIWQQYHKGITHLFQIVNGQLTPKLELNIQLNQKTYDVSGFQTIYNKQRQIIIQKHDQFIYILNRQQDGKLQLICQPIDLDTYSILGTLSNDGQYLVATSLNNFNVYKLIYK